MLAAAIPALITFAKLNNFDCLQIDLKNKWSGCNATNYEIQPAAAKSSLYLLSLDKYCQDNIVDMRGPGRPHEGQKDFKGKGLDSIVS